MFVCVSMCACEYVCVCVYRLDGCSGIKERLTS